MIISEKQIMQLINIAHGINLIATVNGEYKLQVVNLLSEIEKQQSTELREVK